eukprot:3559767-Amphidinium_carterae.1
MAGLKGARGVSRMARHSKGKDEMPLSSSAAREDGSSTLFCYQPKVNDLFRTSVQIGMFLKIHQDEPTADQYEGFNLNAANALASTCREAQLFIVGEGYSWSSTPE